jgi:hypothetical protein
LRHLDTREGSNDYLPNDDGEYYSDEDYDDGYESEENLEFYKSII